MSTISITRKIVSRSVFVAIAITASGFEAKAQSLTVSTPTVSTPTVSTPTVLTPPVSTPPILTTPNTSTPVVSLPVTEVPQIETPEVNLPPFGGTNTSSGGSSVPVPEPSTTAGLLVMGAFGIGAMWKRKKVLAR